MRFLTAALLIAGVLAAAPGYAQSSDDERRNAARDFGLQGNEAYDAGDYARAVDLYRRAQSLYPAPTLSVRLGRALVKLGRLVEAEEAYIKTLRYPLPDDAPDAFKQAIQVAKADLAELSPRVPRLKVSVRGAKDATVTLNGTKLEAALVGIERKVDPGGYKIRAEAAGALAVEKTIQIAERDRQSVELTLEVDPKAAATPAGAEPAPAPKDPDHTVPGRSPLPFIALGVGGAGIAVGVVTGLMASSRHSSAEGECPELKCERGSQGESDLQAFRELRTVSTVGYIVGVVGIAAGGVLWFTTAPAASDAPVAARVSPYVGLGHAGVWGRF